MTTISLHQDGRSGLQKSVAEVITALFPRDAQRATRKRFSTDWDEQFWYPVAIENAADGGQNQGRYSAQSNILFPLYQWAICKFFASQCASRGTGQQPGGFCRKRNAEDRRGDSAVKNRGYDSQRGSCNRKISTHVKSCPPQCRRAACTPSGLPQI